MYIEAKPFMPQRVARWGSEAHNLYLFIPLKVKSVFSHGITRKYAENNFSVLSA